MANKIMAEINQAKTSEDALKVVKENIEKAIGIYSANRWHNNRTFVDNSRTPKITDLMDISTYGDIQFIDEELTIDAQVFTQYFYNFSNNTDNESFF